MRTPYKTVISSVITLLLPTAYASSEETIVGIIENTREQICSQLEDRDKKECEVDFGFLMVEGGLIQFDERRLNMFKNAKITEKIKDIQAQERGKLKIRTDALADDYNIVLNKYAIMIKKIR